MRSRPGPSPDAPIIRPMPNLPATFPAYVVDQPEGGVFTRGLRDLALDDLPPGEVTVRVEWSSVNFKDGLAARADGRVARAYPLVPGIDLAGTVVASDDPRSAWARRPANGYDIGTARHGGFGDVRADPLGLGGAAARRPDAREAMAIGTAGFTAAMSVAALEDRGLRPGDGPVLVTGASGGVGRPRAILAAARPRGLGGDRQARRAGPPPGARRPGFLTRDEVTAPGRPLDSARWAGAVTPSATRPCPTSCERSGSERRSRARATRAAAALKTTVFPFILRGVALLGMDSANLAIEPRRALWDRIATDLRPRGIEDGDHRGRPGHAGARARRDRRRRRRAAAGSSARSPEPLSELPACVSSSPRSWASARSSGSRAPPRPGRAPRRPPTSRSQPRRACTRVASAATARNAHPAIPPRRPARPGRRAPDTTAVPLADQLQHRLGRRRPVHRVAISEVGRRAVFEQVARAQHVGVGHADHASLSVWPRPR